ncbi:hypothetical protein J8L98_19885 [Pseudoalteromonas sp. MMG013]|uniref:hypothetical protein n=1 Tax=Pseudoalteromonas sp. MMG013 TaxID=2822687 RepID=UPI001B35A4F9|nr:hypothetical protein [Pseudoalteromonas sp. MMG013]MBQ4863952.1 hypothetical protein [Pseudoalteromonas sp. MMG013]
MYGKLITTSVVAALLQSTAANALPDLTTGNPLDALGMSTPAGVGNVMSDSDKPLTLHVAPVPVKQINGLYAELGGAGPGCDNYVNTKTQAYRQLATPVLQEQAYLKGDFVSNWYQLTYGIPRANFEGLNEIKKARKVITDAALANQGLIDTYNILKAQWNQLNIELSAAFAERDRLERARISEGQGCFTSSGGDFAKYFECITKVTNKYQPLEAAVASTISDLQTQVGNIRTSYLTAKGAYDAYKEKLVLAESNVNFHSLIINSQSVISKNAWTLETDVVKEHGKALVGLASAGYNIWDKERDLLSTALRNSNNHQFSAKQLNLFNVRVNSGVTRNNPNVTASGESLFSRNVWSYPADTLINKDILNDWKMPFEREEIGDTIHFDAMDEGSFASGGIDFFVTRDARCGDYSQTVEENYSGTENNVSVSWKVTRKLWEPQPNRAVFVANLGLSYNYYAYPGPISGECSINVDRMNSYWRSVGKSTGWSWFKRKTSSWDNTVETARDNMGMECKLDLKPQTNDPDEAARIAEEIEREMYSDMWQMFLSIYAKSYDIELEKPELQDPKKEAGLTEICNSRNTYCRYSNIVLKALNALGGTKATGTTSHVSRQYGKIYKRFDKKIWNVQEGSALVQVKVCVDNTQCN